jgi:hypothetical protein
MTRPPGRAVDPYDPAMNSPSLPVLILTGLGAVIALLGLFAAGNVLLVIVGLVAVAVAGALHVAEQRRR